MTNPDDYRIQSNFKRCVEGPDFGAIAATTFEANAFLERIQALAREAQRTEALQNEVTWLEVKLQAARKNPGEADVLRAEVETLKEQVNTHEMRNSFEQQRSGRLEAELQTKRHKRSCTSSEPAYMADGRDVFWTEEGRASGSLPGMHHIIFYDEEEAYGGLRILNELVKQRDQARARVAELEGDKRDAAYFQECLKAEETAHRLCFRKMKDLEEQARKGLLSTGPAQILQSGLQTTPVSDGLARDKALVNVGDIEAMLDQIKARCSAAHYAASCLRDTIEQGGAE